MRREGSGLFRIFGKEKKVKNKQQKQRSSDHLTEQNYSIFGGFTSSCILLLFQCDTKDIFWAIQPGLKMNPARILWKKIMKERRIVNNANENWKSKKGRVALCTLLFYGRPLHKSAFFSSSGRFTLISIAHLRVQLFVSRRCHKVRTALLLLPCWLYLRYWWLDYGFTRRGSTWLEWDGMRSVNVQGGKRITQRRVFQSCKD